MHDERFLPAQFLRRLDELADSYVASADPRLQSGFGGGEKRWRAEREPILSAVDGDGTLLDIGCANGFLLESLVGWAAERGIALSPHGIDQSPELVGLARDRLPDHAENFLVANAWSWRPSRRFRYVYSLADVVPAAFLEDYVTGLMETAVENGGRLILGSYGSESRGIVPMDLAELLGRVGYDVAGTAEAGVGPTVRFAWVDRPVGESR